MDGLNAQRADIPRLLSRERLSWLSSLEAPWLSISQDGVEDDEELADAGGERLFGGFSGGSELLIICGDDRVGAACDQRGHVEGGPVTGARPPAIVFSASQRAAVAIDGSDADEGGDFAPIEAPELRQFGDECAQSGFAHSEHAGQEIGVGLPGGALRIAPSMSRSSSESSVCKRSTCRSMAFSTRG